MVCEPRVNFSMRELDRLNGDLKPGQAAERLGLTVRQIERLVIRSRAERPIGLISRHRNRPGNRVLNRRWSSASWASYGTAADKGRVERGARNAPGSPGQGDAPQEYLIDP
jgi:hypothetical protein